MRYTSCMQQQSRPGPPAHAVMSVADPYSSLVSGPPQVHAEAGSVAGVHSMGTVLVLGARGRLGFVCVQAFAQAGWTVLAQVRRGSALAQNQSASTRVRWVDVPLDDEAGWHAVLEQRAPVHVVVNALSTALSAQAWEAQLQMLTDVGIAMARRAGALLLAPLSMLPWGRNLPPVLHEGAPLPALSDIGTRLGVLRAQTEPWLVRAADSGLQVCTLRAGTFYGHPGDGWIRSAVTRRLQQGVMDWLGPYDVATPWAYVPDLAQTLEQIARHRHRLGIWTTLHFAGHQRNGHDWLQALEPVAQARGWVKPGRALQADWAHWGWMRPVGLFSARVRALREMRYVWHRSSRLDNQQLLALIGREPRSVDWPRSVAQTVELLFPP